MNTYFSFKQFTIHQAHCAQKVSEMACLFGAWIPLSAFSSKILDVGSGTGLLSLMLAQKFSHIQIDALEIEQDAFLQGKENIENSPFRTRISLFKGDFINYKQNYLYDAIIANPPFHEKQLVSDNLLKNKAWHSSTLTLRHLINGINSNLSKSGEAFILLPKYRIEELYELLTSNNLYIAELLSIRHSILHETKLVVVHLTRNNISKKNSTLIVKENNLYTHEAKSLLKDFYLHL